MEESAEAGRLSPKITRVETIPLEIPLRTPFKIANGPPRQSVEVLLVRLHIGEGITGVGETQAWRRQGSAETLPSLSHRGTRKDRAGGSMRSRDLRMRCAISSAWGAPSSSIVF